MNKSPKQVALEQKIADSLQGKPLEAVQLVFEDAELQTMQDYANNVSIKRMGFNDHGPVHMRLAALNALTVFRLLKDAGVVMNLENEAGLQEEDSLTAVLLGSLLHDLGMTVSREQHEEMGMLLAAPVLDRLLARIYPEQLWQQVAVKSTVLEGIGGHMATRVTTTLEAGLVLIGDGCDMEHGRARIPELLSPGPQVGDIHRYSASAIERVSIYKGQNRPVRINVLMSETVGYFQVEEVLFPKISSSPVKPYIELWAGKKMEQMQRYL